MPCTLWKLWFPLLGVFLLVVRTYIHSKSMLIMTVTHKTLPSQLQHLSNQTKFSHTNLLCITNGEFIMGNQMHGQFLIFVVVNTVMNTIVLISDDMCMPLESVHHLEMCWATYIHMYYTRNCKISSNTLYKIWKTQHAVHSWHLNFYAQNYICRLSTYSLLSIGFHLKI